ncbi:MAG: cytochrome c oxidase assembly protein [Ginsengibacter sp.]
MRSIFSYWHFDFITSAFLIILCFFYLYTIHFKRRYQTLYFFSGIALIILCVASPLHFLGEHYLFSAHMVSHVLLLLIAAPLLVAGIPKENRFKKYFVSLSTNKIKIVALCWFTGVGIMWLWHIPYIFNQATSGPGMVLMHLQWLSLLVGGIIFCWPVINPYREFRIPPLSAVLYLSTACVFCTILGLMITFAPLGIYSHYLNITDSYGYLNLIRNQWKISAEIDQQAAGLIMWVPCCFIYLTASMVILINWFERKEAFEIPTAAIINN